MGRRLVPLVVLALAAAGCSHADEPTDDPTDEPTGAIGPATSSSSAPAGGAADSPTALTATEAVLDWRSVPGPTDLTLTTDGAWTLSLDESAGTAQLTGPIPTSPPSGVGDRVSDALLGDDYALVVHQDPQEQQPATAVVTDLATGATATIDADTPGAPTTSGGTWALDGDRAAYATIGPDGAYCLASADLATGRSSVTWCAPERTGFNAAHLGADGDAILTFDDSRPSCRTVVTVSDAGTVPFEGVEPCVGFEGAVSGDGAIWSVVPDEERIEAARFRARIGDDYYDLGPGTSGTLTPCAGAAYFVQDPQDDGDPARLLRWVDGALSVAYTSPAGQAFLAEPRCAGDVLTLSSFSDSGDEQVSATLR